MEPENRILESDKMEFNYYLLVPIVFCIACWYGFYRLLKLIHIYFTN
jgi:hypothetical protein